MKPGAPFPQLLLLVALLLILFPPAARAAPPDPDSCSVQPADNISGFIICPDSPSPIPGTQNTITVRDTAGVPMANIPVTIQLSGAVRTCATSVLTGMTNLQGVVVLTLRGSGCVQGVPGAALVIADGVVIRSYGNIKSPDFNGSSSDGVVLVDDLYDFAKAFCLQTDMCHDYTNNGAVTLADLVYFADARRYCSHCTLQP